MSPRPTRPVRTIFLGSGRFGQPALSALVTHPAVDLVAVVTAPPRPVGRRQIVTPTPIETQARDLRLAVRAPRRLRNDSVVAELLAHEPGLLVLADYGQIVPGALLDVPYGALNLHPSLLPRHRGSTPIPAAILAGDRETGVTLFRMDDGVDTGPIIAQDRSALAGDETAPGLEARLAITAAGMLARSLDPWLDGELTAQPQPADGATLTRPFQRGDGRLDPNEPAAVLERRVRAYQHWPGTFIEVDGQRIVVLRGSVAASRDGEPPGRLVLDRDGLALTTVAGRLIVDEVQPAGGRAMTADAFVRGHPGVVGRPIGSSGAPA